MTAVLALALEPVSAQEPVPTEFQDLYGTLQGSLDSFNTTLSSVWNGSKYPVLYTANLRTADANAGPQLVGSTYLSSVQSELQALKAMGVQAIEVEVGFPMLYQPFFPSQTVFQQYVDFYTQVANSVRALGLKLVVENEFLLSNDVQAGWNLGPFYASLTWDQYQQARSQTAVVVAQTMHPDYLVVVEEPDIEATMTGQTQANTVDGSTGMLNQILTSLQQAGITGTQVGAGVGTWHPQFLQFTQSFVALPVDFIDMHIFPINYGYLPNALTMVSTAAAAGKPVTLAQSWTNKVRDSELSTLTPDQIRARNVFSFWQPLDAYFTGTMENLANYAHMAFMVPFNSTLFYAYLPYDSSTQNLSPAQLLDSDTAQATVNNQQAIFTFTAMNYYTSIVSPPDTSSPSVPTNVTGVSGAPTQAAVSWNASTDNVGVAGYYVFRNGVNIAQTASPYYQDTGLMGSTTYTYFVQAFDLGGNVSGPSQSGSVTTQDVVPPTAPTNVVATALSTKQIKLSWSPATDDVGISNYRVFKGTSPTSLTQVATLLGTTTTFTDYPLNPMTTYYYSVQAADTSGNLSPMSSLASATTLNLPSAPTNLTATPTSTTQISLAWSAGPSGMPIQYYQILRGASPSTLVKVASVTTTCYTDRLLGPSTTYYYAVQEVDSDGNLSPGSSIAATTLTPPQPPTNVLVTSSTTKLITLTWTAGPSSSPIKYYRVWRGSSPSTLAQLANCLTATYTDRAVSPSTTYYYAVMEVDTTGASSAPSAVVSAKTLALPAAPINVAANAISTSQITVSWSPGPSGMPIASYTLFRGMSPSSVTTQVATTTNTSSTDRNLTASTTYYYAVAEVDSDGNVSPVSTTVSASTLALPSAPTNVAASAVSRVQIIVTWTAAQSGMPLSTYRLFRGSSPASLVQLGSISATKASFSDYPVAAGTTYYYGLQAVDTGGNVSPMSEIVGVTTPQ